MDELLASLAISGANFIGKAAFSIAAKAAMKKIQSLVDASDSQEASTIEKLLRLHQKLEYKLSTLNPLFEICQRQGEACAFQETLKHIHSQLHQLETEQDIDKLVSLAQSLSDDLQELGPFMSMSFSSNAIDSRPLQIPLAKLMRASCMMHDLLSRSSLEFVSIRVFSMFTGNEKVKFNWKEEFPKGRLRIQNPRPFQFHLVLEEELDDDRYHEPDEKPLVHSFDIDFISSFYYSTNASLLKIQESESKCLVFKHAIESTRPQWWAIEELESCPLEQLESLFRLMKMSSKLKIHYCDASDQDLYAFFGKEKKSTTSSPLSKNKFLQRLT